MPDAQELLNDVKNYLDITWEDPATDKKLCGMISRGMKFLNELTGSDLDFTKEEPPRELLFIRVMYERSGGLDDFRKNYSPELNSLAKSERMRRSAEKEQTIRNV